jgi:nitrate reductase NapE component
MRAVAVVLLAFASTVAAGQPPESKAELADLKAKEDSALKLAEAAKRFGRAEAEADANARAAEFRRKRLDIEAEVKAEADRARADERARAATKQARRDADTAKAVVATSLGVGTLLVIALVGLLGFAIWLTPVVIAVLRRHPDTVAITALCLLLGWSFVGWVVSLVWALKAFDADTRYR